MQKKWLNTYLKLFTEINSKLIIDLNLKYKTLKLLEDNTVENSDDLGFSNDFLVTTPKAQSMKEKEKIWLH